MVGKVVFGVTAALAAGATVGAAAWALGSARYAAAGIVAAATALVIAVAALYGLPPENEESPPMSHAVEYKATCPAGHARFGPGAHCATCEQQTDVGRPIILETKEGGRAVAWPDEPDPLVGEEWR